MINLYERLISTLHLIEETENRDWNIDFIFQRK